MTEALQRRALVKYSKSMYAAGWVANHDGNLSTKIDSDRYVITPTAMSKNDIELDDLVVVDGAGKKRAGRRRAFSEMALHLAVYRARPDVGAVVHAHPPFSTAYGVSEQTFPHPFLPEAVVSLGASIPTVPLTMPGQDAVDALAKVVRCCDGVLIAGNGVLTWGPHLELAYLRMELIEHLAKIAHTAISVGGPTRLPDAMIEALVKKRMMAGLAAPDEGLSGPPEPRLDRLQNQAVRQIESSMPTIDRAQIRRLTEEITATFTK
jgi:L-fuculose-phosphate aldolase